MVAVTFDVVYTEQRSRLTTFFRYILAIPHLIVASLWSYLAQLLAILQWFVILFTGRRNEGMWNLQRDYLAYNTRVNSYVGLLFDEWPAFGGSRGSEPVAFGFDYPAEASRLTNGLRFLWIIPALIIGLFLGIAVAIVAIVSWLAIVITGRHPRRMFDFMLRVMRFSVDVTAYGLLMTDDYPRYEGSEPTGVLPPGDGAIPVGTSAGDPGDPLPPPTTPPVG